MKKILIYTIIIILVVVGIFVFLSKNKKPEITIIPNNLPREAIDMCYQYSKDNSNGFADRAWLKMNISGEKVTGEYQNLPAESDSKIGKFDGVVGKMDPKIGGRIADVWWDSMAEGMEVKEQLKIEFGEGSAVAFFGEMVDRGDGVYIYKDMAKLSTGFQMTQIDCEALNDKIMVEKYIRSNIKTIVPEKPVLGGSWYVVIIKIDPSTKTGTMTYEDGHIQGSKNFSYVINNNEVKIILINNKLPESKIDETKEPIACTMDAKQCPDGSYVGRTPPKCEFICP